MRITRQLVAVAVSLALVLTSAGCTGSSESDDSEANVGHRTAAAVQAPIAHVHQTAVEPTLDGLGEAKDDVARRAANVTRRASNGAISTLELAGKIPVGVRGASEQAIRDFLGSRHLSHVRSVKNAPQLAASIDNLVFESPLRNLARGSRDMSSLARIGANLDSGIAGASAGSYVMLTKAGQGCVVGGMLELPIAAFVEAKQVEQGKKTTQAAVKSAAISVGKTAAVGCVASAVAVGAVSATGLSLGAPILVPIAVAGGVVYFWVSSEEFWSSLEESDREGIKRQLADVQDKLRDYAGTAYAAADSADEDALATIRATVAKHR